MPVALIATVGGTPQPLIKTIIEHKPDFICFLCSQDSVEKIADIKAGVKEQLSSDKVFFADYKVIINDINDLISCYARAEECVRRLKELKVPPEKTVVDYTGGTKTMSVALGLAAVGQGFIFSYVGGTERTKEGLGVVVDGTEQVRTGISPWSLFAIEERRRVADSFNIYQFTAAQRAAAELLSRQSLDARLRRFLQIVELLCQGYSAWDRFAHTEAVKYIKEACGQLELYVSIGGGSEHQALVCKVKDNLEWLQQLQEESRGFKRPTRRQVADLVANAARRAEEGKYDDAVARLYRAVELDGQIALSEPPLLIESASDVPEEKIPESLRQEFLVKHRDSRDGKIKLPLRAVFTLLAAAGHPHGLAFMELEEELLKVLNARNSSILAHGLAPVGEKAYHSLNQIVCQLLEVKQQVTFPKIVLE